MHDKSIQSIDTHRLWSYFVILTILLPGGLHLIGRLAPERFASDDFFYYYVTVINFVHSGMISFDSIHPTNGFHPLWFAILAVIYRLLHQNDAFVLPVIAIVSTFLPILGAFKIRSVLQRLDSGRNWFWLVSATSITYAAAGSYIGCDGMEVTLTLFLFPFFFDYIVTGLRGPLDIFKFTLLSSAIVLSRLDSAMVIGIVWLYLLGQMQMKNKAEFHPSSKPNLVQTSFAAAAGWLPLLAYLLANLFFFHALMPESATAKALTIAPGPYYESRGFFTGHFSGFLCSIYLMYLAVAAVGVVSRRWKLLPFFLVVIWPFVFYVTLIFRSPWNLWRWYSYPIIACAPAASVIVMDLRKWKRQIQVLFVLIALLVFGLDGYLTLKNSRRDWRQGGTYNAAITLKAFAATHPGVYAMGDGAGFVGYKLGQPLVQLEGLVGGERVIAAIRQQQDLLVFLRQNHIDYYIAINLERDANGCYMAVEPAEAGNKGRHMKARLCFPPVFIFQSSVPGSVANPVYVEVFNIKKSVSER